MKPMHSSSTIFALWFSFRVTHAGHASLTTQLFFKGDKYLDRDPWIKDLLNMAD